MEICSTFPIGHRLQTHFWNQDLNTWKSFPVTPTKTSSGQAQECSCILLPSSSNKELVLILRALPFFLVFPSAQLPRWWSALRTASCIHSTGLTSSVQELDSEIPLKSFSCFDASLTVLASLSSSTPSFKVCFFGSISSSFSDAHKTRSLTVVNVSKVSLMLHSST